MKMLHFRLLWDNELVGLRPLLQAVGERCEEVIGRWYHLCALHFGDSYSLSEAEFSAIFLPSFRQSEAALFNGDFSRYAAVIRNLGEELAKHEVPVTEIILSLHLYEQSVALVCQGHLTDQSYTSFDKLSHVRMALLAEGYFGVRQAGERVWREGHDEDVEKDTTDELVNFHGLVGSSIALLRIQDRIEAAARTRGTVLLVGESGTGKELVARAIHKAGPKPNAPFVAVNCPAIPRDLIESELFGHKRGSFSGADADYVGLFRAADGGTLLLDEATEMNLETQSKLLRVLQERTVRPVGSASEIPVNVRLIASTNRQPEQAIQMGVLRQDLYYRLGANVIEIPPLRDRPEDIPALAKHFIAVFNAKLGRPGKVFGIGESAMAAMLRYSWPGNVRELSNALESAITFGRGSTITVEDLPSAVRQNHPPIANNDDRVPNRQTTASSALKTFDETERELIARTLRIAGNNKTYAAELLQISRKKLYARLLKYGLLTESRRTRQEAEAPLTLSSPGGASR